MFFEAPLRHLVNCRMDLSFFSTPWPISGWPHDLNPSSLKLQKHKNLKNFSNLPGTKRKVVGKGRFSLRDFLPEVIKLF
jgi:hypothetical protein